MEHPLLHFAGTGLLPDAELKRTKEAFSDAVSSPQHSEKSQPQVVECRVQAGGGTLHAPAAALEGSAALPAAVRALLSDEEHSD